MLKIIYTEAGLHVEHSDQTVNEWLVTQISLTLTAGRSQWMAQSTASLLLPAPLAELHSLGHYVGQTELVSLSHCDLDYIELVFRGTWVAASADAPEGVFVVTLAPSLEALIVQLWQVSQSYVSSSC